MQKIFVTGFVGRDPEEKKISTDRKVTTFSLGVKSIKKKEGLTTWYKVSFWGAQCKGVLSHVKKGNCLTIVGDLNPPNIYENKNGDMAIDMSITGQSIYFVPSSKSKDEKEDQYSFFKDGV